MQWLYFVAIENLPVGVALLIEFTAPLFVALFARFVYKEHVRRRIWVSVALCLTGLALVVELWSGVAFSTVGVTAAFGGALALTAYLLMAERERRHRDAASLSFYGFLFAALLWAVVQPLWKFPWGVLDDHVSLQGNLSEYSAPVWVLVAFIVLIGTMITFSLLTGSLKHISATRASIVATLEPVVATVIAWAWLGETFGADPARRRRGRDRGNPRSPVRALTRVPCGRWLNASSSPRRAATAQASSAPSRPSSARSSTTARPSTSASRSSTTSTSCATSRRAGAIFVEEETEVPRGRDRRLLGARRRAVGVRELRAARPQRDRRRLPARDEGARAGAPLRGRGLHGRPHRARGTRGGRGHDGRGARARPCSSRRRGGGGARAPRPTRSSPTSRRRRSRSTRRARSSTTLRRRFPEIRAPRKEDICYATSNRQWAVKEMLPEIDLLLVIGSRNSSNSNRLVETLARSGHRGTPDRRRDRDRRGLARRASRPSGSPRARPRRRSS